MTRIPPLAAPVVTSEEETAVEVPEEVKKTADKPYFIYVGDLASTECKGCGDAAKAETVIFKDERVALGSRAFHAVRMSPEDAAADPLLQGKGKQSPRILFVGADLKSITVLEQGRLSVSGTWDAMKATASKFYKENLDKVIHELRDVLFEYDKIEGQRKVLADKEARAKDKPLGEADRKELAAAKADLDARLKKAQDREQALFDLKPKAA